MRIYFLLSFVAFIFCLLGFLVHAFYFNRQGLLENLEQQIRKMKHLLESREAENERARDEIARSGILVQSLERQLDEKGKQVSLLQEIMHQQDGKNRPIPEEIHEVLQNKSQNDRRGMDDPAPVFLSEMEKQKIPLWKDHLNNILQLLNKIEKEANK